MLALERTAEQLELMSEGLDPLFLAFQEAVAGRYSIDRELGRGGMGVVYLAREVDLDRPVAIKLLPPDMARAGGLRERFLTEARTSAKLSHPNIIPIHSVDEVGGFVFFAMAYVDGETLADRVRRRGPLPASEAARVLREVSWALSHAHGQGVIHRDVKPDNILLESGSGRALVADFGIAAAAAGGGAAAEVTGTPEFMSPEQALGKPVDARSDLYSLGVTAYYALSGVLPFTGATPTEVLARQVTEPPRALAEVAAGVPRRVAQAVERCLAKEPDQRPASAEAVSEQLGLALEHRRELPVALRAFVKHSSRLDGGGALVYPFALLIGAGVVGTWAGSPPVAFGTLAAGLTIVPLGVLLNRARRLLRQGFGQADLAPAFKAEIEQGREERAVDAGHKASVVERLLRWVSAAGWVSFAGGFALALSPIGIPGTAAFLMVTGVLTGTTGGVGSLVLLQRRRDLDAEFYGRLWAGPVGRTLFRIARLFTSQKALAAPVTHRPTELSIGMAAEELYKGLPRETRHELRALPGVLRKLEDDAQGLRKRQEELQEALAEAGRRDAPVSDAGGGVGAIAQRHGEVMGALKAERDLIQEKLVSTVAALETIRLSLLRLVAGSGTVQSLTTDIGLASDVAKEVDLLLETRKEVEEIVRPSRG